jgi:hypothetical protein
LLTADTARQLAEPEGPVLLPVAVNADSLGTGFLPSVAPLRDEVLLDLHRADRDDTAELLRDGTVVAAVTAAAGAVTGCTSTPLGVLRYTSQGAHVVDRDHGSAAGHRPHDQDRLVTAEHRVGQRRVRRLVREVLLAGVEPHEGPSPAAGRLAHGAAQRRMLLLQRVQHLHQRGRLDRHLALHLGEGPQVVGQHDASHGRVCTSTDSTDGRSRTMAAQLSPPSGEQ